MCAQSRYGTLDAGPRNVLVSAPAGGPDDPGELSLPEVTAARPVAFGRDLRVMGGETKTSAAVPEAKKSRKLFLLPAQKAPWLF